VEGTEKFVDDHVCFPITNHHLQIGEDGNIGQNEEEIEISPNPKPSPPQFPPTL
jgi:hypothetical protein